jgi:TRAP-type C4-dicarboxylate transport system permease small subunit
MQLLRTLDKWLVKLIEVTMILAFSVMCCLVFAQVIVRYVTGGSLVWSDEAARFLMVYFVLFGMVHLYRSHGHIWVANLIDILPGNVQKMALSASYLLQILFFIALFHGFLSVADSAATRTSAALLIPMNYIIAMVPISGLLMMIYALRDFLSLWIPARRKHSGDNK